MSLKAELGRDLTTLRLVVFDFDGVFTDNRVYVDQDGRESVCCSRADGLGLRRLDTLGVDYLILSSESNPVVSLRAEKLAVRCLQGLDDKLSALKLELDRLGLNAAQTAYVGNDINDRDCLDFVGLPMVVADAHPEVLSLGRYRTRRGGGQGAVREICDLIYAVRGGQTMGQPT
jgi:3-deoxy-D-manno-octulosonate 8-phosphate phosphatase (KDO 8-P phosphatase)